jgi:hypothetical protein
VSCTNRSVHSDILVITGSDEHHAVVTEPLVEVFAPEDDDAATLNIAFETDTGHPAILGIEGALAFVSAHAPDRSLVMDRIVDMDGDVVKIPAGDYSLRMYYRTCDANCGVLDPSNDFCTIEQALVARATYKLTVTIRPGGASTCSAAEE